MGDWIVLLAALVVIVREADGFLEGRIRRHAYRLLVALAAAVVLGRALRAQAEPARPGG